MGDLSTNLLLNLGLNQNWNQRLGLTPGGGICWFWGCFSEVWLCLPRSWCTFSALTWTPGSLLTPNIPMAKPSLPNTSSRLQINQVLELLFSSGITSEITSETCFLIKLIFLIQILPMKTCFASTRAASTHPTTSWFMSATSTACPRYRVLFSSCPQKSFPGQIWGFFKS